MPSAVGRKEPALLRKGAKPEDIVTINFVEDGLTAFGRMWYRGQEVSIEKGSPQWESTVYDLDTGESWMELDEDGQIDRWGVRFFRPGKWAGEGYDLEHPDLTDEEKATLAAAVAAEKAEQDVAVKKPATTRKTAAEKRRPGRPPSLKTAGTGSITP